ncbi:tRNA (cytidine(34)-2'-O)-methyltransferase [Aureivirga sp. CE67]|uniref:tRNA (cytidine(34)-2'-O)-methyltransferase n=1 Tax=Aureivirga sp. CE67 TaxID=1788983 RepID=UPI0018CB8396|nr:tRNA (cytidine(34)-2'-O)-methyltransferase [Aureivirga sp. CE67]
MEQNKINFNIVLVEPEIPNNTGNIGRLCVGSKSKLHLVKPLGFEITDKRVKRAGLDYWGELELQYHENFEAFLNQVENRERMFFFSSKGAKTYYEIDFKPGDWLIFGKESVGLGKEILERFESQTTTIPFPGKVRSFNISNAVAMALGEGLRQLKISM